MTQTLAITALTVAFASSTLAQGVFINSNRNTAVGLDAPVYGYEGERLNSDWVAQVWAGSNFDTLAPISSPAPFRDGTGVGYWNAPVEERTDGITVPGVGPGETAYVQVFVWQATYATIDDAQAAGGFTWLPSEIIQAVTGTPASAGPPPVPAAPTPLLGLTSGSFGLLIPEPTSIALGCLGSIALGWKMRRRKN